MKRKKWYSYLSIFDYADDGINIYFPDLPGCFSCADTTEEAVQNAKEAMGLYLWGAEKEGLEIPIPTPLNKITLSKNEAAHVIEVFMPPIREKINNGFTKKTLSLPAWLADKADEAGVNCSKIFQKALIDYLGVSSLDAGDNVKRAG